MLILGIVAARFSLKARGQANTNTEGRENVTWGRGRGQSEVCVWGGGGGGILGGAWSKKSQTSAEKHTGLCKDARLTLLSQKFYSHPIKFQSE